MPALLFTLSALAGLLAADPAEPIAIDLEVRSGMVGKTAHAESAALDAKPKERPVLEIKAGDRVAVKWTMKSADPAAKFEDVTVHFYAVAEEAAGQPAGKKLTKGVVAESALNLDLGPGEKNEGELNFTLAKPGFYLLRVETIGAAAGPSGHESFAALDVKAR